MAEKEERRIRYAVVGLGNIAQVAVLPAFAHAKKSSELVALISSDPSKRDELAKKYGVKHTGSYDDLESILERAAVDAVYLAVPNSLHREGVERAARKGVHVLCEKPLATTVEDCEAMIRVAHQCKVKLMVGYRLHFERTNLDAVERIRKGEIGEPRLFSSVFCHQVRAGDIRTRPELGGGALFDLGIYCINAARYLFRAEPTSVFGERVIGRDRRSLGVDEATTAILRFPDERLAQFSASQGAADVAELRVVGTKGDIRLDPAYEYAGKLKEYITVGGDETTHVTPKHDQFAPELEYFSDCILHGVTPEPSGREGLADVRIMQAIIRSYETGARIELDPFDKPDRPSSNQATEKPPVGKVKPIHAPPPSKS